MTSLHDRDGRALVDELEHARAGRLHAQRAGDGAAATQRLGPLRRQVLLGLEVGGPAQVEAGIGERAGQLDDRLGRDRVLRQIEVPRPVLGRERRQVLDAGLDGALAVAGRADLGEPVVAERALAPVAAARRIVGQGEDGREVLVERQSVEVGRRQGPHVLAALAGRELRAQHAIALHEVRDAAERARGIAGLDVLVERATEGQQRVLALEDDGRVERPERRRERGPPKADEQLRDGGPADREVHARQLAPQLEAEREGGLQLPGEAQREPDGAGRPRRAGAARARSRRRRRTDRARAWRRARSPRAS